MRTIYGMVLSITTSILHKSTDTTYVNPWRVAQQNNAAPAYLAMNVRRIITACLPRSELCEIVPHCAGIQDQMYPRSRTVVVHHMSQVVVQLESLALRKANRPTVLCLQLRRVP